MPTKELTYSFTQTYRLRTLRHLFHKRYHSGDSFNGGLDPSIPLCTAVVHCYIILGLTRTLCGNKKFRKIASLGKILMSVHYYQSFAKVIDFLLLRDKSSFWKRWTILHFLKLQRLPRYMCIVQITVQCRGKAHSCIYLCMYWLSMLGAKSRKNWIIFEKKALIEKMKRIKYFSAVIFHWMTVFSVG